MERSRSCGAGSVVNTLSVAIALASVASTGLLAACGGAAGSEDASTTTQATVSSAAGSAWAEDLAVLDRTVREQHPAPFWKTDEKTWAGRIAELKSTLPTMTPEQARIALIELVALLDTHSGVFPEEVGFHFYRLGLNEFSDGVFLVNAQDPALIGSRVTAIGGTPVEDALTSIEPLVNGDNESAVHDLRPWFLTCAECLDAVGVTDDAGRAEVSLERADGTTTTVDLQAVSVDDPFFSTPRPKLGPTAARRRDRPVWWRFDRGTSTFLLSYNEPGVDVGPALKAMKAALAGTATRVVLDMRYARGGAWNLTFTLRDALSTDPRLQKKGALTVLIGREDVSASTALASWLDVHTNATLVGEPTPARPNPPLDETTFTLPNSGITVHIPTNQAEITDRSDDRTAVTPDVPVDLSSVDFFEGRDRALEVALGEPR